MSEQEAKLLETRLGSECFIRLRALELVTNMSIFRTADDPKFVTKAAAEFERFIIQGNR